MSTTTTTAAASSTTTPAQQKRGKYLATIVCKNGSTFQIDMNHPEMTLRPSPLLFGVSAARTQEEVCASGELFILPTPIHLESRGDEQLNDAILDEIIVYLNKGAYKTRYLSPAGHDEYHRHWNWFGLSEEVFNTYHLKIVDFVYFGYTRRGIRTSDTLYDSEVKKEAISIAFMPIEYEYYDSRTFEVLKEYFWMAQVTGLQGVTYYLCQFHADGEMKLILMAQDSLNTGVRNEEMRFVTKPTGHALLRDEESIALRSKRPFFSAARTRFTGTYWAHKASTEFTAEKLSIVPGCTLVCPFVFKTFDAFWAFIRPLYDGKPAPQLICRPVLSKVQGGGWNYCLQAYKSPRTYVDVDEATQKEWAELRLKPAAAAQLAHEFAENNAEVVQPAKKKARTGPDLLDYVFDSENDELEPSE